VKRSKVRSSIGVAPALWRHWEQNFGESRLVWRNSDWQNNHNDACEYDRPLMDKLIYHNRNYPHALLCEHAEMPKMISQGSARDMVRVRIAKSPVDRHLRRLGFSRN